MHRSKRFPFTERENIIIRECVNIFGEDWEAISTRLPGRTPKQIHDRYVNYLRNGLIKGPWTKQEDDILIHMFNAIGPKWTKMMVNLPGRSGNDIKNRWHKHLMKKTIKLQNEKTESNNHSNLYGSNNLILNQIIGENNNAFVQKGYSINIKNDYLAKKSQFSVNQNSVGLTNQVHEILKERKESSSNQVQSKLQNFDLGKKNFQDDFNNKTNMQNITDQNERTIKVLNKFDIMPKSKNQSDVSDSNKIQDITSTIFKPDYEIQEILEDLNFRNIDFPWI